MGTLSLSLAVLRSSILAVRTRIGRARLFLLAAVTRVQSPRWSGEVASIGRHSKKHLAAHAEFNMAVIFLEAAR
jgi:hypothetical protein